MRYLAIDYGTKTTGLAICDPTETVVSPLVVLPTSKDLISKIVDIVKNESVQAIVLGLPMNMDDSIGPQAKIVQDFANELKKMVTVPIYFQDERLSTFAAEEKLISRELTQGKKRKRLDAVAAAEILQAFLDAKNS
jgi:putative Holliday junction resolvase